MNRMTGFPDETRNRQPYPQRVAIVTDAWRPQMNGVVRTLTTTCAILQQRGHTVEVISPDLFRSVPCPTYPDIRWFHAPARRILVATESVREELRGRGLGRLHAWSRGVDLACFNPQAPEPPEFADLPRPIQLYVGRVAVEKNIEAFLSGQYPGSKVVVGDGPALAGLRERFPDAHFIGRRSGAELAGCYAHADVFVFPSRTDTFGLVMIEALACGTPVAAFPVAGPVDIVTDKGGALSEDLDRAIAGALFSDRADCAELGARYSWDAATDQFLAGLVALDTEPVPA